MPDLNAWLGDTEALSTWKDDYDRAHDIARHIAEKSASITITRAGAALAAQTVRIEASGGASERLFNVGALAKGGVIIVGYKGHPTIADTNIRRGDRFAYDGQFYSVTQVLPNIPDRLLAIAEAREA